jgi:hypothetical protein
LTRIVTAWRGAAGILNRLGVDVGLCAIIVRARDEVAEAGGRFAVILKVQAGTTTISVGNRLSAMNGRRPSRLPIHSVEHDQNDVLLAGRDCHLLQSIDISLIEILG